MPSGARRSVTTDNDRWCFRRFHELTLAELYALLKLRQDVFIVEQQCYYEDLDDIDQKALHILALDEDRALVGYARILAPGVIYTEASIGRIIVAETARGSGLGGELVRRAIEYCLDTYAGSGVRIAAQAHLQSFYQRHGFETVSEPRDVDGILHVEMVLR